MKKTLLFFGVLIQLGSLSAQISNLPVSAESTALCNGDSTNIILTGSEVDIRYSLRNSSNTVIGATQIGTGGNLTFNTGILTATETFNIYAEPDVHSVTFDGTSSYAQLTANNRGVGFGGMTIGVWIRTTATNLQYVASKYTGIVGYLFFMDANGRMNFDGRRDGGQYTASGASSTSVNDGQWHYVVGTTNGQAWNIFVDGVLESSGFGTATGSVGQNNTAFLRLGMHNFANFFDGEMDDFSLFQTPLTPATIATYYTTCLAGTESSLTALFDFDEATSTIIDSSPVAVNGFIANSTHIAQGATACLPSYGPLQMSQTQTVNVVTLSDFAVTGPASSCPGSSVTISTAGSVTGANYFLLDDSGTAVDGPIAGTGAALDFNTGTISTPTTFSVVSALSSNPPQNSSLQLDGIDEWVDFGADQRTIGNNISAGVWVKTTSSAATSFLLTKYDPGFVSGFVIIMNASGNVKIDGKAYTGPYVGSGYSSSSINDGQWHYVVGTGEVGGNFKIYVDGVLESTGTATITGVTLASFGNLQIGTYNGNFSNAEFDQIELWKTTLTDAEIATNMNTCLDVNDPNLVGYYQLNEGNGTSTVDKSSFNIPGALQNMEPALDWLNGIPGGCLSITGCNLALAQEVTVSVGNNAPVPDIATLADITGQCEITSLTPPTATDDCSGSIPGTSNATFPITANTTVTWTYDDGSGNTTTQAQSIVLSDLTAPVADLGSLPTLTEQCELTSLTPPTATDNCVGSIVATHNASLPITSNTSITWTYDDGNGNTSTQSQNVVINDNTAPVADLATLPTITENCSVTTLTPPTAIDNCSGTITATHTATLPITSNTTITWTFADLSGNTTTQTQSVVIDDVTAPVPDLATLTDVVEQCSVTSLTAPSATDNCSSVTVSNDATLPITASTTITWIYTDLDGNQSTQPQNIVVNDNTAPIADLVSLTDLTAQCEITTLTAPSATDNCDGAIIGTHNATLPITSSSTIVWTYTDGSGNSTTQNQNVAINDNTAPIPDAAALADLTAQCEITTLIPPTATDNCAGIINGTQSVSLPISSSTTVTWTFDDGNGNVVTQDQEIIITDNVAPVPNAANLPDVTEYCEITNWNVPIATDNCSGSQIDGVPDATLPITANTTVTWSFADGNGNTSTQTQDFVITPIDNTTNTAGITITANQASADGYQWVDCDNGFNLISGATNQSFTPTANGNYAVEITIGGCTITSSCESITTVGLVQLTSQNVQLYPNPTNDVLYVKTEASIKELRVLDLTGALVRIVTTDYVDVTALSTGSYLLEIQTETGTYRKPFVVSQ